MCYYVDMRYYVDMCYYVDMWYYVESCNEWRGSSQRWRAVADTAPELTSPEIKPQTSAAMTMRLTLTIELTDDE